jgi:RNA polymerase sigma-70 factor (ECF subfamily)
VIDHEMREVHPVSPRQRVEDSLVDRARAGDEAAWVEIVRDIGPRLRGYARAKGAPDPDDVMQDVLLAVAGRLADFEGDDRAFRSWVFSIAFRQIANRHRVAGREDSELPALIVESSPGPEDSVMADLAGSDALAALQVLDELERDIVLMRIVGELDSAEVGRAVGKRPGTIRVIQSRALAKVRDELVRRGYGGDDRRGSRR